MAETALRLRISGKVRNVRFRGWLVGLASGAGLRGWVRNRSDGAAEALPAGPGSQVHEVAGHCRFGPPAAVVGRAGAAPGHDDGSAGFRLRPTV